MMTISQFAERTGLSCSALRFYERRGLLRARRRPNGYRVYAEAQIADARFVRSLRDAGVAIAEIRRFLTLGPAARTSSLERWREQARVRLLGVEIAMQYLEGLEGDDPAMHLERWDEPSWLAWFPARAPAGPMPFVEAAREHAATLRSRRVAVQGGSFVRALDLQDGCVIGEVGFRLTRRSPATVRGARIEEVPPTAFVTLECTSDDERAAHRVFGFLRRFGLTPRGLALERYVAGASDRYELMIAAARG